MSNVLTTSAVPNGFGATPVADQALGILSSSTGMFLVDGAVGAGVGYIMAPRNKRGRYALGMGLAAGLGGLLGLALGVGYLHLK
jgi:hypothetical protein